MIMSTISLLLNDSVALLATTLFTELHLHHSHNGNIPLIHETLKVHPCYYVETGNERTTSKIVPCSGHFPKARAWNT